MCERVLADDLAKLVGPSFPSLPPFFSLSFFLFPAPPSVLLSSYNRLVTERMEQSAAVLTVTGLPTGICVAIISLLSRSDCHKLIYRVTRPAAYVFFISSVRDNIVISLSLTISFEKYVSTYFLLRTSRIHFFPKIAVFSQF